MVTILPPRDKGESFGATIGRGIGEYLQQRNQNKMQQESLRAQEEGKARLLEKEYGLKGTLEEKKRGEELKLEEPAYKTMSETFGQKFADVWKASPQGARTKLTEMAIDATLRGEDVNQILQNAGLDEVPQEQFGNIPEKIPQMQKGKISKDFEWPDFTKRPTGYTPKTWADQKSVWRKENAPLFTQNVKHLDSLSKDIMATKSLDKINQSKKLPEGLERLLINPETGDFYGLAEVFGFKSPEAQQWSKVIAQFQNRAKEAFGSRITNFDLQSYMKQFPGLLNTYEGRKRIIRMMDINWKLDQQYSKAIDEVYKHYGLGGIPQEKADELARKMISGETEKLKEEFENLDFENERESGQLGNLSGQMIDVIGPDGQIYEVDQSEVGQLPEGFRLK